MWRVGIRIGYKNMGRKKWIVKWGLLILRLGILEKEVLMIKGRDCIKKNN